jgi:hypothetical protein
MTGFCLTRHPKEKQMKTLASLCLCYAAVLLATAIPAFGQNPDYSTKTDFLNGRRVLLQVDDIVLFGETQRDKNYRDMGFNFYNSTNSTFAKPANNPISSTAVTPGIRSKVAYGRWWESNVDMPALIFHEDLPWITLVLDRRINSPHGLVPSGDQADVRCQLVADYTGDGYDDLIIGTTGSNGTAQIVLASASDVTKPSAPAFGPPLTVAPCMAMAQSDLDGNGQFELVYVSGTATYGLQITIYAFDPKTWTFSQASTFTPKTPEGTSSAPIRHASITAGNFKTDNTQQLALAYAPDETQTIIKTIDVRSLQMFEGDRYETGSWPRVDGIIGLQAERLFATQATDSLVFFFAWHGNAGYKDAANKYLKVFSVDPTLKLTPHKNYDFSTYDCVYDYAIGNFDYHITDPNNANQTELSMDKQLALVGGNCDNPSTVDIHVLTLASDFTEKTTSSTVPSPFPNSTSIMMIAGDAQGRSMILGQPDKVTLSMNQQTTVVVAAPPSHVDFIAPLGQTVPIVLNVSAMPQGFNTSYAAQTKGQSQSTSSSGSSWGVGAKQSVNQTLSIGDVAEGEGLEEKSSFTAAQDFKGESDKENGSYSSYQYDVTSSSGAGDNLWYSSNTLNIWTYPVLGRKVCPKAKPQCSDSEKIPLTLVYSAPDNIQNGSTNHQVAPWYQPSWEYGNLLSYPVNLGQLQALNPDINLLTSAEQAAFSVSGGAVSQSVTWASGSNSGSKSSFTQNYSFDASLSVQGAVDIAGVSVGGGYGFDVSSSFGFSSQTTNQQSLDTSTGIIMNKPLGILDPANYTYRVTPYVYGRKTPANVVDTSKEPTEVVRSYGALRSSYTADIYSSGAGGFWRQAYGTFPDVGLSHPARWAASEEALQAPPPANCRTSGANNSEQICFDAHAHTPADPWNSASLAMQGLFITNAPTTGNDFTQLGPGPNLTYAKSGTKLRLQARVYNFSFAPLPAGSSVHVQFYGMPINTTNYSPAGPSFKIGPIQPGTTSQDVVIQTISPLSDAPNGRNWVYTGVDFDTTPYSDKYLAFWVVVWAETGSAGGRKLVQEIQGHGLSALPPDVVTSLSAIPVEMNTNVAKTGQVSYSNNLGFYRSVLYVAAPAQLQSTMTPRDKKALRLGPVEMSTRSVTRNQPIEVSTTIRPQPVAAPGAIVKFYDGHPADGGTLIQTLNLPWIRSNEAHQARILYRPGRNGLRRIWAFVSEGTEHESVRSSPVLCVGTSCSMKGRGALAEADEQPDPREKP